MGCDYYIVGELKMTFKKGKDILEIKTFELYKQKHYGNNPCCDYEDKILYENNKYIEPVEEWIKDHVEESRPIIIKCENPIKAQIEKVEEVHYYYERS